MGLLDKINMSDKTKNMENDNCVLCEPIARYSNTAHQIVRELEMFNNIHLETEANDIKVVELFAGVGGFRIGLERASKRFKTIWSNQWEPSTKRQDASIIYCRHFGKLPLPRPRSRFPPNTEI